MNRVFLRRMQATPEFGPQIKLFPPMRRCPPELDSSSYRFPPASGPLAGAGRRARGSAPLCFQKIYSVNLYLRISIKCYRITRFHGILEQPTLMKGMSKYWDSSIVFAPLSLKIKRKQEKGEQ
jgi:hypothetical protein